MTDSAVVIFCSWEHLSWDWGLADLLKVQASAKESVRPKSKKSLIVFWTHGGMSQQDTYDMKPDAPAEYRGMYRPISTSVSDIHVTERFPLQAKVMHHISQVRIGSS